MRRRINLIEQTDSQSESSKELNEENMVLHKNGARNQPFVLEDKITKEPFNEQYVDFNNKSLNLLGFTTVDVKVGKNKLKNARVLIKRVGKRSLVRRDWLNQLNFRVGEVTKICRDDQTANNINKQSKDLETLTKNFPDLFKRKGKIKGQKIKIESKGDAKVTHQKGR